VTEERSGVVSLRWLGQFLFIMLAIVAERGNHRDALTGSVQEYSAAYHRKGQFPFSESQFGMHDSLNSIGIEQ
jgi:hypothetical protein